MFFKIPANSILNAKTETGILPPQLFYIGLDRKPLGQWWPTRGLWTLVIHEVRKVGDCWSRMSACGGKKQIKKGDEISADNIIIYT